MQTAIIRQIGKVNYGKCWDDMKAFTEARTTDTIDELWLVEHDPVFTLGLAGKEEHILVRDHNIPIIRTDRGGQVTYHGPGQIVIYLLIDLKRLNLSIRNLVTTIENSVIEYLDQQYNIKASGNRDAPGVYVDGRKIASLGLKIRKGCSYHGLSFNFMMDKTPFGYINPCGYTGLQVVNLAELARLQDPELFTSASNALANSIIKNLYTGS